jgi:hypothetical protein
MGQNISEWNCLIENLQAVRDLGSGRKIMVGSQHPEQLAKKIMEARAGAAE